MAIVEGNHGHAEVTLRLDALISRERTACDYGRIHARGNPPEAAAPEWWVSVRLLVTDNEIL